MPYSDAATGIAAARRAWVIYDRGFEKDRMHADRLVGDNVTHLPARYSSHFTMSMINKAGVLSQVTKACADLTLTPAKFAQLYRQARENRTFLEQLARKVAAHPSEYPKRQLHRVLIHRKRPWIASLVAKSI